MSLVSYGNGNLCHLKPALLLHHYGDSLVQDRPHQKAWHSLPRWNTSTAQREAVRGKSIELSIYLWMSIQLMLQMKKWCNKAICSIKRQKLWSQWPLGAAEREKAVCRSEAWTGKRGTEADLRRTATQSCCTAGCFAWGYLSMGQGHAQTEAGPA